MNYVEKLIVGGFEGVYEFSSSETKVWINHNPEFTVMEIYVAYTRLQLDDGVYRNNVGKSSYSTSRDNKSNGWRQSLDFKAPRRRVTMIDAIKEQQVSTSQER